MKTKCLIALSIFLLACLNCDFFKPTDVQQVRVKMLPIFDSQPIQIPARMVQAQDSVARLAVELIQFQDSLAGYMQMINLPKDSLFVGPPWNHFWATPAGVNAVLNVDERDTIITEYANRNFKDVTYQIYKYELRYSGYDAEKNVTYSDWLYIKASMGTGSINAKMTIYEDCSTTEYFHFSSAYLFEGSGFAHEYRFSKSYKECTRFTISYLTGSYSCLTNIDFTNDANNYGFTVSGNSDKGYSVSDCFIMQIEKDDFVYELVWDIYGKGKWVKFINFDEQLGEGSW